MIHLKDGSIVPVDKKDLPVKLPEDIDLNVKRKSPRKPQSMEKYYL